MKKVNFQTIADKVSRPAAIVWEWLNKQETTKVSGPPGAILNQVEDIANAVRMHRDDVQMACIALALKGLARITPDQRIRAA